MKMTIIGTSKYGYVAPKEEFEPYQNGSRCTFPDFTCGSPCGFAEGIKETREI